MSNVVEVKINGQSVYFETGDYKTGEMQKVGGLEDVSVKTVDTFNRALKTIHLVVSSAVEQIRSFDQQITPDEFQLKFGVKLSGEYGAVVTKVCGEAQIEVTATYNHRNVSN